MGKEGRVGGKQLQTGTADNLKNHRVFGNDGAIISMKRLFGGIIQREQSFLQCPLSHLQKMSVKIKASVAYFINQCVCLLLWFLLKHESHPGGPGYSNSA